MKTIEDIQREIKVLTRAKRSAKLDLLETTDGVDIEIHTRLYRIFEIEINKLEWVLKN